MEEFSAQGPAFGHRQQLTGCVQKIGPKLDTADLTLDGVQKLVLELKTHPVIDVHV